MTTTNTSPSPKAGNDPLAEALKRLDYLATALARRGPADLAPIADEARALVGQARDGRRMAVALLQAASLAVAGQASVDLTTVTVDGLCDDPQCEPCAKRRAERRQAAGPKAADQPPAPDAPKS